MKSAYFPRADISIFQRIHAGRAVMDGFWSVDDGEDSECGHEGHPGDDRHVFHQFSAGRHRAAAGGGHQCGYGIDIRNPWISGASGPLRDWDLQNFVRMYQSSTFLDMAIAIGKQSRYNATIISNQVFQMNSTTQIIPEAGFASVTRHCENEKERDDVVGSAMCFFGGGLQV